MRVVTLSVVAPMIFLSGIALAQQASDAVGDPPAVTLPEVGGPLISGSETGPRHLNLIAGESRHPFDKVASGTKFELRSRCRLWLLGLRQCSSES
jgi:hypothetical protein